MIEAIFLQCSAAIVTTGADGLQGAICNDNWSKQKRQQFHVCQLQQAGQTTMHHICQLQFAGKTTMLYMSTGVGKENHHKTHTLFYNKRLTVQDI